MHVRVPPAAEPLIRDALHRFYADGPRPTTEPVALGWMLECLAADLLAGPDTPHPMAAIRKLVANRVSEAVQ